LSQRLEPQLKKLKSGIKEKYRISIETICMPLTRLK
jgi:hypothetical protein